MVDLRRLRSIVNVLALVAVALGGCSLLLNLTIGRDPLTFLGSDWTTYTLVSYRNAGEQISGALHGEHANEKRLAVALGASTLECGIDPVALTSAETMPWRWLSLYGKGSTAVNFRQMTDLALRDGLRPEVLVLAINLGALAQSGEFLADPQSEDAMLDFESFKRDIKARQLGMIALRAINRTFPYRTRVYDRIEYGFLMARLSLLRSFAQSAYAMFPPLADPWHVEADWVAGPPLAEKDRSAQMAGLKQRGWFDASSFSATGEQNASVVKLVDSARRAGVRVVILLLPESSVIHKAVPDEAEHSLRSSLESAFGKGAPPIMDLRDAMPDSAFHDLTHLAPAGRLEFTKMLSKKLPPLLDSPAEGPSARTKR